MTETHPWVPLEGVNLLVGVRDILVANPERHDQSKWVGNVYLEPGEDIREGQAVSVDQIRVHMFQPVPEVPVDSDTVIPPCGTTGCAFGWAGILSAPSGSSITDGRVYLPDGTSHSLFEWVPRRLGLSGSDAEFVYSPIRSREQLIRILDALIADPEADIRVAAFPQ